MSRFYELDLKGKHWLHKVIDKDIHTHEGDVDEGRMIYSEADEKVYVGDTLQWNLVTTSYDIFPQNTKILMGVFPLPNGWNIDNSINKVACLVTSTLTDVGTSGGTDIIYDIEEGGSHDHGRTNPGNSDRGIGKSDIDGYTVKEKHTHGISVDGGHFHFFEEQLHGKRLGYCIAVRQ